MSSSIKDDIQDQAIRISLPKGGEGDTISIDAIASIAKMHGQPGYVIEAEALKDSVFPTRYLRNMDGITSDEQIRLLESSVAQVGLGGLGGNLLEMFIRTGIGRIRAADGDNFEESNLNRQALSSPDNIDRPKSDAGLVRTNQINPSIAIETWNEYLNPQSLPDFLANCDIAIDALGGLKTRLALQQAATEAHIPLVTGALAGWTGYVGVVMPGQLGPADIMGHDNAAEETLGCPSPAVTFIASLMATETLKILTKSPASLTNKMLLVDLKHLTFETISI